MVASSSPHKEVRVPRYLVERRLPGGLAIPANVAGARACQRVVEVNAEFDVTWLHSYVSEDLETMVDLYEGLDPESIRRAADRNGLPVQRITRVTVLDPWFYTGSISTDVEVARRPGGHQ
jgi:hypothetical protein